MPEDKAYKEMVKKIKDNDSENIILKKAMSIFSQSVKLGLMSLIVSRDTVVIVG